MNQSDGPVERMRWVTSLTRLYWSTLPPNRLAEMLKHEGTRERVFAYVHAHSAADAAELREFMRKLEGGKAIEHLSLVMLFRTLLETHQELVAAGRL